MIEAVAVIVAASAVLVGLTLLASWALEPEPPGRDHAADFAATFGPMLEAERRNAEAVKAADGGEWERRAQGKDGA